MIDSGVEINIYEFRTRQYRHISLIVFVVILFSFASIQSFSMNPLVLAAHNAALYAHARIKAKNKNSTHSRRWCDALMWRKFYKTQSMQGASDKHKSYQSMVDQDMVQIGIRLKHDSGAPVTIPLSLTLYDIDHRQSRVMMHKKWASRFWRAFWMHTGYVWLAGLAEPRLPMRIHCTFSLISIVSLILSCVSNVANTSVYLFTCINFSWEAVHRVQV